MDQWINFNGEFYPAASTVLTVSNRGLRYGDGLFETMLVGGGRIRLGGYHFDRLFAGMRWLGFEVPAGITAESLGQQVLDLCKKNGHPGLARARLTIFRGEGHLFDKASNFPEYVIESSDPGVAGDGLRIGIYPEGRKACDRLANLKSNNFLLYAQAARYSRDQGWDDCLVLNGHDRVADACIANVFCVREGRIYTPPLSEGCVAGVMRRFLLGRLRDWGFSSEERPVTVADLQEADELFLTNAVRGIRGVGEFQGKTFAHSLTDRLQEAFAGEMG